MGSLWPSGRASEREIKRFDIRFLMGTLDFLLLSDARDKTIKYLLHNRSNVAYLLFVLPLERQEDGQNISKSDKVF